MIVCLCNRINESDLRAAARCHATVDAAYDSLGCEPQCGCCCDYAQELIDEERGKRPRLRIVRNAA